MQRWVVYDHEFRPLHHSLKYFSDDPNEFATFRTRAEATEVMATVGGYKVMDCEIEPTALLTVVDTTDSSAVVDAA